MRTAALTSVLFVAFGYAANSQQLTLLPHVGFENSRTTTSYNDLRSFAPLGGEFSPQAGVRLDYKFKQGFGPYLGISTSRSIVLFSFTDPENGMNIFNASPGNMQLRFEGGYQFSTNPVYFNKSKQQSVKSPSQKISAKKNCGEENAAKSSCCSKSYSASSSCCSENKSKARQTINKNKGNWIRLLPSIGVGFIPSVKTDVITKMQGGQTTYEYKAGNWNTALMTGVGFEFGRNKQRLFNVSVNYFNGIGNLNKQTITSVSGSKTTITHLESDASGWNVKVGIPFTLAQKNPVMKRAEYKTHRNEGRCGQYRIEYKTRCRIIQ